MGTEKIDVLLIEDDDMDAEAVRRAMLRSQTPFRMCRATSLAAALEISSSRHFDVIISDLTLPDSNGRSTPERICRAHPNVTLIVLTGRTDTALAEELLEAGVQDYVVKETASSVSLERSIRHAIQRQQNCTRISELLEELEAKQELLESKNSKLTHLYSQAHEFVDNISHEFRTPLTVIKEYTSLIQEGLVGEVSDEQRRLLSIVEDRADDLNIMVDDMLDNSKLEADMLCAWRKECHVSDLFNRVRQVLERKASVREVNLHWDLPDGLPMVYCDAEKAGRVITNLAINAIKFCDAGGTVEITAESDASDNAVWIRVADNGPGIDEPDLAEICNRFTQVASNVRTDSKGFGLGLNIAQQLVQLNFGELSMQSQRGVGSTFSFSLAISNPREIIKRYLHQIMAINTVANLWSSVSIVAWETNPDTDDSMLTEVELFLNYRLRRNDILLRSAPSRWIIALPIAKNELHAYFERIQSERIAANRNRPFGPLPEVTGKALGTWPVADQENSILEIIENEFSNAEQASQSYQEVC